MKYSIKELADVSDSIEYIIRYEMNIDDPRQYMGDKNRFFPSMAIENPKKIGYFKDGDVRENPWNCEYRRKNAIMTKPGKFFRHLFPDASDSTIQKLVSKYLAMVTHYIPSDWHFFLSDNVKKWYHQDCYISTSGSLGCSCMKYEECQDYLDFYDNYPVSILVLKNSDDKIKGRALIWKNVFFPYLETEKNFMDRIYCCDENDVELFKQYAIENDFVIKERQSMSAKQDFQYGTDYFSDTIEIVGDSSYYVEDELTPYLDTLTYATYDGNLCNEDGNGYDYCLESTSGRISPRYCCDICGESLDEDGIYSAENDENSYCENCFHENYVACEDCNETIDRNYIYNAAGRDVCENCRDNNYQYCDCCNEYFEPDTMVQTIDDEDICRDCARQYYTKCDICGLYEGDKYIEQLEGKDYCSNCIEEIEKVVE